jgi:hypothetical protein
MTISLAFLAPNLVRAAFLAASGSAVSAMPPRNGHVSPQCLVFPFRLLSFDPHPCTATHVTALESTLASDYESGDQEFESLRARHFGIRYRRQVPPILRLKRRRVSDLPTDGRVIGSTSRIYSASASQKLSA